MSWQCRSQSDPPQGWAGFRTLMVQQAHHPERSRRIGFLGFLMLFVVCSVGIAEDWPTYRSQITRSGITSETIGPRLFLQWKYIPTHRPKPAWPMPSGELPRMHNDNAYHVVMAGNNTYFGSCVTNKVYSIDAANGKIRWVFITGGPVRFDPAVYDGRVYDGYDDGYMN